MFSYGGNGGSGTTRTWDVKDQYGNYDEVYFESNDTSDLYTSGPTDTVAGTTTTSTNAGSHQHSITTNYEIHEQTLTSPSVNLSAGAEGNLSNVGTYTTSQNELDLSSYITTSGAWHQIQFGPNKNMRIDANAYIQIFLEST